MWFISLLWILVSPIPPDPSGSFPTPPWWRWPARYWSTSPWLRTEGRRRCAHRWSRLDWHSGSRLGSSSRRAPRPRCGWRRGWRRRCPTPGRAGCPPGPSAACNTSTLLLWRWWSSLSTRRRSCRCRQAQRSRPRSPPGDERDFRIKSLCVYWFHFAQLTQVGTVLIPGCFALKPMFDCLLRLRFTACLLPSGGL